jgi:hypothetical protein
LALASLAVVLAACASPGWYSVLDSGAWNAPFQDPPTQDPPVQDPPTQGPPIQDPSPQEQWQPPAPDPTDFDWIKLTSGEWLKGDIEGLRSDSLEFDSDELDTFTFDWEDIVEVRSPRQNTFVLDDLETLVGTVLIRDDLVIVGTAEGERRFPREDLLSIIPGAETEELGYWSGGVSIGATAQAGNTDLVTTNVQINLQRNTALSRIGIDYISNFGELNGDTNVDNSRFTGKWDLFLDEDWFITPAVLDMYRDPFQNIAFQATPGVGVGYTPFRQAGTRWDVTLIGGWRYTEFDSVGAGEASDDSTATLAPTTRLEWDVTPKIELTFRYGISLGLSDLDNTNHHLITTLSLDVWGDIDLDLTFQWDRIGDPQRDAAGDVPDNDDFRMSVGLGWDF